MECTVEARRLVLREPLRTAWGELRERELLEVTLTAADGVSGRGEAAPLEPYDGVTLASVRAALDAYGALLAGAGEQDREQLRARCARERPLPQALAAIDLALWDMEGKRAKMPVAALLHADPLEAIPVNAVVHAQDRAGAAAEAATAIEKGFTTVKVKVGIGDDGGRLAAIRAAVGPATAIRVDANGAWRTAEEALANLRALAPLDIELCEEPVHGVDALRAVAGESPIRIAMDETNAPGSGATPLVCLKVSRSGGIDGVLDDAQSARAAGSEVYLASTFDGPLGIAAALHAAAALHTELPCGLATLDAGPHGLQARGGRIAVPASPGLLG